MATLSFFQRESVVDQKWRLTLPSDIVDRENLSQERKVFFKQDKDGCLVMYFSKPMSAKVVGVEVNAAENKKAKTKSHRVMIPRELRSSMSFYFGKTLILADKGKCLSLWPRPS